MLFLKYFNFLIKIQKLKHEDQNPSSLSFMDAKEMHLLQYAILTSALNPLLVCYFTNIVADLFISSVWNASMLFTIVTLDVGVLNHGYLLWTNLLRGTLYKFVVFIRNLYNVCYFTTNMILKLVLLSIILQFNQWYFKHKITLS